jgi:hypothetical protein
VKEHKLSDLQSHIFSLFRAKGIDAAYRRWPRQEFVGMRYIRHSGFEPRPGTPTEIPQLGESHVKETWNRPQLMSVINENKIDAD